MWTRLQWMPYYFLSLILLRISQILAKPGQWPSYRAGACDETQKRETTYSDIEQLHDKFTKRYGGKLSFIGEYPAGLSACSLDPLPPIQSSLGWHPVAVNKQDFIHSLMCGTCLKITERSSHKRYGLADAYDDQQTWYATVIDKCDHCKNGELRMYSDHKGEYDVIYEAMDCPDIPGKNGLIRLKMSKCSDKRMKLQVRNTKLPPTSVELYQNNGWKCMKRTSDNFFLLSLTNDQYNFPLKGRATTITGQTVGFTLNGINNAEDVPLLTQFGPFDSVSSGDPPKLKCYGQGEEFVTAEDEARISGKLSEKATSDSDAELDAIHKLPNNAHFHSSDLDKTEQVGSSTAIDQQHNENKSVSTAQSQPQKKPKPVAYVFHHPHAGILNNTILSGFAQLRESNSKYPVKNPTKPSLMVQSAQNAPSKQVSMWPVPDQKTGGTQAVRPKLEQIDPQLHPVRLNSVLGKALGQAWMDSAGKGVHSQNIFPSKAVQSSLPTLSQKSARSFCIHLADGQYAYPSNCVSFVVCQKGQSDLKHCPLGLRYNAADSVCDWPQNVACLRGLDLTALTLKYGDQEEVYTKKYTSYPSERTRRLQDDLARIKLEKREKR